MNDDLPSMHEKESLPLLRLLFQRVPAMRGGASDIGQTAKAPTGGASVPTNEAGQVDAPADSGCDQEPILSMSMFASKADYDAALLAAVKAAG